MGLSMEINLAIYGGAFCAGALATVTIQWAYGEWLWRLDRRSVVMPDLDEALARKAAVETLLEMIDWPRMESDPGEEMPPPPVPNSGRSDVDQWGMEVPSYEG
jgi:hypothetical protein